MIGRKGKRRREGTHFRNFPEFSWNFEDKSEVPNSNPLVPQAIAAFACEGGVGEKPRGGHRLRYPIFLELIAFFSYGSVLEKSAAQECPWK